MFAQAPRHRFHTKDLVILERTADHRADLAALEEELLQLATFARGWGADQLDHMRAHFKIEPFYNATSMVLVFEDGRLIGTAGVDTTVPSPLEQGHILHLCSVNFHPSLQGSSLVALLVILLADHVLRRLPADDQVYFTSISQSPLVYSLMAKLAPVFPDGQTLPPEDVVQVAQAVVDKYDPHLPLEPETLTLRSECDFFYRDLPVVADARINTLFRSLLDVPAGDVFVNVARCSVREVLARIERYRGRLAAPRMEMTDA